MCTSVAPSDNNIMSSDITCVCNMKEFVIVRLYWEPETCDKKMYYTLAVASLNSDIIVLACILKSH